MVIICQYFSDTSLMCLMNLQFINIITSFSTFNFYYIMKLHILNLRSLIDFKFIMNKEKNKGYFTKKVVQKYIY